MQMFSQLLNLIPQNRNYTDLTNFAKKLSKSIALTSNKFKVQRKEIPNTTNKLRKMFFTCSLVATNR